MINNPVECGEGICVFSLISYLCSTQLEEAVIVSGQWFYMWSISVKVLTCCMVPG